MGEFTINDYVQYLFLCLPEGFFSKTVKNWAPLARDPPGFSIAMENQNEFWISKSSNWTSRIIDHPQFMENRLPTLRWLTPFFLQRNLHKYQ
jgi:hypothetical protein